MRTYGQYCPVAKATELLADRWTPLILRELLGGSQHFNELERGLPGIPRSLLAQRLRRLEQADVIERRTNGSGRACRYEMTSAGLGLRSLIQALGEWGAQWLLGDPLPEELDGGLLLWRMHRRVNHDRLPRRRVVLQFDFRGARTETLWLVLKPHDVSICVHDPGFELDLLVSADIAALHRVFVGRLDLADALRDESVGLEGAASMRRAFGTWFGWSPFAETVRQARRG